MCILRAPFPSKNPMTTKPTSSLTITTAARRLRTAPRHPSVSRGSTEVWPCSDGSSTAPARLCGRRSGQPSSSSRSGPSRAMPLLPQRAASRAMCAEFSPTTTRCVQIFIDRRCVGLAARASVFCKRKSPPHFSTHRVRHTLWGDVHSPLFHYPRFCIYTNHLVPHFSSSLPLRWPWP